MVHSQSGLRADASLVELWQVYTDMGPAEQATRPYQATR
jgi:hypothetical protein